MKPNPPANPILALAQRALAEQWPATHIERELEALARAGLQGRCLQEALEAIGSIPPGEPGGGQFIALVGQVCAALLQSAGHADATGAVLLQVANTLLDRYDAASFALAVALLGQARGCFASNSPSFGGTLMNEANARLSLAELGVDPAENLPQAVALYAQARGCFASNSPSFGRTLMNEANARQSLAQLGVDPAENLHRPLAEKTHRAKVAAPVMAIHPRSVENLCQVCPPLVVCFASSTGGPDRNSRARGASDLVPQTQRRLPDFPTLPMFGCKSSNRRHLCHSGKT